MYIAEIAPGRLRAGWSPSASSTWWRASWSPTSRTTSSRRRVGGPESRAWRSMLGVPALPAALFFLFLRNIPESPRWLVKQHRRDEATAVLRPARAARPPGRSWRRSRSRSTRRRWPPTSRSSRASTAGPSCSPSWSPAFNQLVGHQRAHLLHRRHLRHGGRRARERPAAVGHHRLHQPGLHHGRHDGHRPLRPAAAAADRRRSAWPPAWACRGLAFATRLGGTLVLGSLHRLHRLLRLLAGSGDLGLPQRDLPEPRAGPRPGAGQLHPLVLGGGRELDLPGDRRGVGRPRPSRSSPR